MPVETKRAVGLFHSRQDAENALMKLRDSGFDMNRISVVNKDTDTSNMQGASVNADKENQVAESAGKSAAIGGVSGGAIGLIGSLGILAIPGVGPAAEVGILLANTVFAGALGAASGGLLGALVGWGLPEDQAQYYSDRVNKSGDYLVIVEGDTTTINSAQTILQQNRINDWRTFSATGATGSSAADIERATPQSPATGKMV
ncbi:MAG: signal transduction histidine kinase (STHK), LytS [Phormidesmis sp.]